LMSVAIAAFSGVLPYAKLLAMIFCWLCPVCLLPVLWRGRILLILDQIGKYSLLDIFVVQFISGTLYASFKVGDDMEAGSLAVALRTNLEAGFASFVLATVGSLALGHICLHHHDHEHDPMTSSRPDVDRRTELLLPPNIVNSKCSVSEADTALNGSKRWYVGPVLALNLMLTACGCALPAFTVMLSSALGGTLSESSYSMFSFAATLPDLSEAPNSLSTRFGQFTFAFFVIISNHLHLAIMLYVWNYKVSSKRLALMSMAAQALFSSAALDVAMLSMVITLAEMSISDFLWLNTQKQHFVSKLTGIPHPSDHGLTIGISLGVGTWVLIIAALMHAFIGRLAMVLLERAASALNKWEDESSKPPNKWDDESCNPLSPRSSDFGVRHLGVIDRLSGVLTNGLDGTPKQHMVMA